MNLTNLIIKILFNINYYNLFIYFCAENVLKHYNFFKINLKKEKDTKQRQFDPFLTISDETDNKDEKKKLS